jgi:hypothetical protein
MRLGMAVRADAARHPPKGDVFFVISARDRTVKSGPVLDLAREWRKHAVPVSVYEFPDSLNLPHNVIDNQPAKGPADAVASVLLSLARDGEAPSWVTRH